MVGSFQLNTDVASDDSCDWFGRTDADWVWAGGGDAKIDASITMPRKLAKPEK